METKSRKTNHLPKLAVHASILALCSTTAVADHPTLGLQQDAAGPVTTLTAIPLPAGVGVMGFESQYISNNAISDHDLAHFAEDGEQVHSVDSVDNLSLNAAYGVSDNLTLGLNLPWVSRRDIREGHHHHEDAEHHDVPVEGEIERLGESSGLGDLTVYGQYRFLGANTSDLSASFLFGVKLPTGRTDVTTAEGDRFETDHQPGSGSLDLLSGIAVSRQWSNLSLDGNILYSFAGNGTQDSNLGDVFNYNIALSRRFGHSARSGHGSAHTHAAGRHSSWDAALELNGEWRDRVRSAGQVQEHTGGNVVYLASSVRYNGGKNWSAYASLGVPVIENLNGIQSDPKYRFFIGVSMAMGAEN